MSIQAQEYQKLTSRLIADLVNTGGFWTRLSIARRLNRKKTTYLIGIIDQGAADGLYKKLLMNDGIGDFYCYTNEPELELGNNDDY